MNKFLRNKKGRIVLKDLVFMMIIFFAIIAFANVFVTEMGNTYDNTNMTNSYDQSSLGEDNLTTTSEKWEEMGERFSEGGILNFLLGTLEGIGIVLVEILTAPITFASMITSILESLGVSTEIANITRLLISGILYGLIVFMIVKAFLRGGDI